MSRQRRLITRTARNVTWSVGIIVIALAVGAIGYHYFGNLAEPKIPMTWALAIDNAAMILAGEGPLGDGMPTEMGRIFESVYALICGFLFFAIAGFALAPALHHILRNFHLEDEQRR